MQRILAVFVAVALAHRAGAQPAAAFDPFPGGIARAYQFNLTRNFFPSESAAAAAQRELRTRARRLDTLARRADRPAELHAMLAAADTLARGSGRMYAYLSLRPAIDTRDDEARRQLNSFAGAVEPPLDEASRALGELSAEQFTAYVQREPRLRVYAYAADLARRARDHRIDAAAERALAATENEATSWGPALFQAILAETKWGTVRAPEGDLDVRRNGNQIRSHSERRVREAGFRLNQAGLASRRDTFALILTRTASARNAIAQQRRWPDYPTQSYASGALSRDQVSALLEAIAARAELNKRYERMRITEIRRAFGYDTVHMWDWWAPPPGRPAPRFTIMDASREIISAAEPLGAQYVRELRALLDPANGRLDLIQRANRVDRAGFSTGSVGYPSMFFQGRFEGYTDDLVILSHEAGHAVQNMLMDSAGVLARYAWGPSYFTESFAMLSELLLLEHLHRRSRDATERRYYLGRLLEDALDLFRNAHESMIEQQLYDSVAAGHALSADGIERLTQNLGTRFSVWFGPNTERTLAWVQPLQFFTRPLYRVNYAIAKLLALQYFDMWQRDPAGFATRYGNLLRNGYDAPPDELLRRFLGVSLSDPNALMGSASRTLERWLREAETS